MNVDEKDKETPPEAPADTAPSEADVMASLDKGIEAATPDETPADDPPSAPGKPAEAKPQEPKPDDKPAEPIVDEAEAEIAALGLKERSAARFRELTGEVKELAPLRDALKAAGIEKVEELPTMVAKAKQADDLIGMVMETGATAEQYGMTLDYLAVVNKAVKGDTKAADDWGKFLQAELTAYTKATGRALDGAPDPLADHADLQAAVANGDISKQYALELVKTRTQQQVTQHVQQQSQQQTQADNARRDGAVQLNSLEQSLSADPGYAAKKPMLYALVKNICATLPPAMWVQAAKDAYASIPASPAPAPVTSQAPAAPVGPVRPTGPRPTMQPEFKSDAEALDWALGNR